MSIEKLAVKSGLTKSTVLNIFKKNDAKISQLEALSSVLGISIVVFFEEEPGSQSKTDSSTHITGSDTQSREPEELYMTKQKALELELCLERAKGLQRENELLREVNDMLKKK